MGSPILQDEGRIALAKALAAQEAYIAWGRGDGAWADQPTPSTRTALIDEIGRRKVTAARFVTVATAQDSQVVMPGNKHYKFSDTPTNLLHLSTTFDFAEGAGETVRECALFFGTTAKTGVPAGQRYLLPSEVEAPGFMYLLEFRPPWPRTGSTQGIEQFILPF